MRVNVHAAGHQPFASRVDLPLPVRIYGTNGRDLSGPNGNIAGHNPLRCHHLCAPHNKIELILHPAPLTGQDHSTSRKSISETL